MLNYRRQRSLTDSVKFSSCDPKSATRPELLSQTVTIAGLSIEEAEKKKFFLENSFLRTAHDKSQFLFNFEGAHGQSALSSIEHTCLFMGTGSTKDFYAKNLLHLGGKIAQQIKPLKNKNFVFWIDSFYKDLKKTQLVKDFAGRPLVEQNLSREEAFERILTGIFLGLYKTPNTKDNTKKLVKDNFKPLDFVFVSKYLRKERLLKVAQQALTKAEATYWVRDEKALPPNMQTPELFVKEIRELADKSGFKIKVLDEKRIHQEGFGGIEAVGKGSINPPRLVIAEYNSQSKYPHLVLIGKGVTFDTGGISLKPPLNMHDMKMDMTGAAIVAGTLSAVAKEKLPIKITALIPIAENRPSHNSLLPGEVYEAWGGTTVEVQNTDAEGRLILADCLAYAQALKADLVIDLATLTGAAMVTLGPVAFMLYGNDANWIQRFQKITRSAGEESWEMPLFDEFSEDLRSSSAHLRNHVGHRDGNSHVAAAFLKHFVDNKYPWLHLDICSYSLFTKWKGAHCPSDAPVGLPILAMIEFAKKFAAKQKR
ncbi:MAG: leucyl aminopeptidase family protein [Bdellovibrionota bacterium]